jgi:hypothetical protein
MVAEYVRDVDRTECAVDHHIGGGGREHRAIGDVAGGHHVVPHRPTASSRVRVSPKRAGPFHVISLRLTVISHPWADSNSGSSSRTQQSTASSM